MSRRADGMRSALALAGLALSLVGCEGAAQGGRISGMVPTDWPPGLSMPVEVPLPAAVPATRVDPRGLSRVLVEVRIGQGRVERVPGDIHHAETSSQGRSAILRLVLNLKPSDLGRPIEILVPNTPGRIARVACTAAYRDPLLSVTTPDNRLILRYWHGPADSKNSKQYPLNDFIHPLIGLDGEELTAALPGDHVHHRGIFWAWVRTERQGQWKNEWWIPRDFVAEPGHLDYDAAGATSCRFTAEHFWTYGPPEPAKAERFVREVLDCRIYQASAEGRAVDVDLSLTALLDGIRIGGQTDRDKGYGGMTCRFGSAVDVRMNNDTGLIHSSSLNHVAAKWVDWTGRFLGPDGTRLPQRSGAALMVHPSHPAYPPEWIVRAYGPIGLAYPGLQMIELPKGKPLRLQYRLWIHRGDPVSGKVPEAYRAYCADWKWRAE